MSPDFKEPIILVHDYFICSNKKWFFVKNVGEYFSDL